MPAEPCDEVIIIDDDPSVQKALGRSLRLSGYRVRTYCSAEAFLQEAIAADVTGCVVLDVQMPGMSGMELQQELQERGLNLPIIFITGHGTIPLSVKAIKAGAVDFLEKPFETSSLNALIEKAISLSRQRARQNLEYHVLRKRYDSLTPREQEVMHLVVAGLLNKQIAYELGIVEKTVKVHRARLFGKMQAASLAELVRMAERLKLPSGSPSR